MITTPSFSKAQHLKKTRKQIVLNLAAVISRLPAKSEGFRLFEFILKFEEIDNNQRESISTNHAHKLLEFKAYDVDLKRFFYPKPFICKMANLGLKYRVMISQLTDKYR